jgi:hypothetical protein
MGRRDKKYSNNTRTLKKNNHPDYGGKSTSNDLIFGGALPGQKKEEYDWTKSPLGKMMMAVYGRFCWTYLSIMGRLPWQKEENKLEKDVKKEDSEEVISNA